MKKTIPTNTLIEMELDRYWLIERVGTNVDGMVTLEVDGIPAVDIHGLLAPMAKSNSNLFGPVALKDLYLVVPPHRKLLARSAASGKVYIEGKLMVLSPGEAIPTEHLARYSAMVNRKLSFYDCSATIGASMDPGKEYVVCSITPPTIEDHLLNRVAGISITGTASPVDYGQIAVKFYYDGKPLDQIGMAVSYHGLDVMKMPLPPIADKDLELFSFADMPVMISGGHKFEVRVVNVSGATISATTGANIAVRFMAFYERTIKG